MILRRIQKTKVLSVCRPRSTLQTLFAVTLSTSLVAHAVHYYTYSAPINSSSTVTDSEDCGCSTDTVFNNMSSSSTSSGNIVTTKDGKPSVLQFKDTPIIDLRTGESKVLGDVWKNQPTVLAFLRRLGWQLCRVHALDLDVLRKEVEPKNGNVVCFSFEKFGEGSDKDRSFAAGNYFTGTMYYVDASVYQQLFGRKGFFNSFYGLGDMSKDKINESQKRGVTGNYAGDGFQLGGQFVVDTDGNLLLEHRQKFYGDDESNDELLTALSKSTNFKKV